jgi:hypothetical protein
MYRRGPILLLAALVAAGVLAGEAVAGTSKAPEVTVARGKFAHHTWSFSLHGGHRHSCYTVSLTGAGTASGSATCEPDRRRPPLFRPLVSISDDKATVEVLATRTRVHSMRLKIGHPRSNRRSEWLHVRDRRITRHQAHKANVKRDFRFAVLRSRGNLCVKAFVLFDREGDRIKKQRVPCEF